MQRLQKVMKVLGMFIYCSLANSIRSFKKLAVRFSQALVMGRLRPCPHRHVFANLYAVAYAACLYHSAIA